jgi:MHS family proline/betaine transporter-like MFS transporter
VITKHPKEALASGALITLSTICTYTLLVYAPMYSVRALHLPQSAGFTATMVGTIAAGALIPVIGHFVDRIGAKMLRRVMPILLILLAYPMFRGAEFDDAADLPTGVRGGHRDLSGTDPDRDW